MKLKIICIIVILLIGCKNNSDYDSNSSEENSKAYSDDENDSEEDDSNLSEKKFKDDSYDASVEYYNPETGYAATYDLEVDVVDNEVVRINFPKGGWLDDDVNPSESRLSPEELDENGEATLSDYNGRTYKVTINN